MNKFASLIDVPLKIRMLYGIRFLLNLLALFTFIVFITGSFPILLFSKVTPIDALKDEIRVLDHISVSRARMGFMIFQFFVCITLVTCAIALILQMNFIKNKNIGLNAKDIVMLPISQPEVKLKYEIFKNEIISNPSVINATAVGYFPGSQGFLQSVWWEGKSDNDFSDVMSWIPVDNNFISTLNIEIIRGEFFQKESSKIYPIKYVLNETAVKKIGWPMPIGKQINIIGKGEVIGIVKDFNYESLHEKITPVALVYYPEGFNYLMIKLNDKNIKSVLDFIQEKWEKYFPQYIFKFSFLEDDIRKMYDKDLSKVKIIIWTSIIALFISCIGLFGLMLFTIDKKNKEISLRKVFGASSGEIVMLLNLALIKLIVISFIISCPISFIFINHWLESFSYKINIGLSIFLVALLATITVSLLTVCWHVIKIAFENPITFLRRE